MRVSSALCLGVLLVSSAAEAQVYRRTLVPGKDLCLTWNKRVVTYNSDAAGSAKTPGDSEFAAIDAAFNSWQVLADSCSDFRFLRGDRLGSVVVGKQTGSADNNVVTFRETLCSAVVDPSDPCVNDDTCANKYRCWDHNDGTIGLTTTTFSFRTGVIFDADIELNASTHEDGDFFLFTAVDSPPCDPTRRAPTCVATDIQNTLTHEIGHLVGLDHVDVVGSTMEATAPLSETSKRVIDSGSATGFCDTYPPGQPAVSCDDLGTLRRKIIAQNVGTAVSKTGCTALPGEAFAPLGWVALGLCLRRRERRPLSGSTSPAERRA